MNTTKVHLSFLFAIFLSLSIFFGAKIILAGTGDNILGFAWSSNIGWIKLNNCDSGGNCGGQSYGVSALMTAPGTLSGYAWSSNLGWITFNDGHCPTPVAGGVPSCTPGAYVDWAHPNSDGSFNIKGWARVCSVYTSGCSGGTQLPSILGGWDGFIALGDPATTSNAAWGLTVSPSYAINGYAWGSDVVGWVQMIGAKINVANAAITDFSSDAACVQDTTVKPNLSWASTGAPSCTLGIAGGTPQATAVSSQAAGGTLAPDGKYYEQSPFTVAAPSTTFTLQCGAATQSLVISICQTATTPPPPASNPNQSCPAGQIWDAASNGCIPVPSCPTGQVWNATANACQPAYNNACPIGQSQDATGQCVATVCPVNTVLNAKTGNCDVKIKPVFKEF